MVSWFTKNWFLAGLLVVAGLGILLPEIGASGGPLRTEWTTKLAIFALFLIRGTLLPLRELGRAALNWRLHVATHLMIFVVFPVAMLVVVEAVGRIWVIDPNLRLGFLFLAALPTTVSTAALFTTMAGGNTGGAVFNCTLSNCLGVLIVPVWMAWILQREATAGVPLGSMLGQIVILVLVPLLLGQALKPFLREYSAGQRKGLEIFSSLLLLFVIFAALADSVAAGVWLEYAWQMLVAGAVAAGVVFVTAMVAARLAGKMLGFQRPDYLCFFFCGTQKTLACGVPMGNIIFADNPALSLILLPILLYHFIQLFVGGFLAAGRGRASRA